MQREAEVRATEPRDDQQAGVELTGVDKAHGAVQALSGVSLRVLPGEIVALAGPSGCGKSTLLELVCGLLAPDAGTVRAAPAALMPQRDALLPWLSALDNAGLALRVAGVGRAQARARAHEHFAAFGLEGFESARPAALSGGMRQRVAFLRTLLAGGVDPLILPPPSDVLEALWDDRDLLAPDLWTTTYEVLLGLAAAAAAGAALGVAMHLSPALRRALRPLVIGSQAVPVPVIAPLVILVFGFGLAPKILLVALVCFFPITINLYDGLRDVDQDARKLLRSLDATRWQQLRHLEAPSALPATFTGAKIAAAVAVIGSVFAEWAGSDRGLGHTLLIANGQLETARAFAATFLLFALAVALYGLFALLERRVVDWTPRTSPGGP